MTMWLVFYLVSFFLFVILSTYLSKFRKLDLKTRNLYVVVYLIGMFLGARALYVLVCEHTLVNTPLAVFYAGWTERGGGWLARLSDLRAASVGRGGMWGGPWAVLLILSPIVTLLRAEVDTKYDLLDVLAASFAFPLASAKIGCFLQGCCYGKPGPGIRFTWLDRDHPCSLQTCFPTQLLDLVLYAAIGVLLLVFLLRSMQRGRLLLWFVLLYALGRFGSEFTRGDDVGGKLYGLSPVQIVLIASLLVSLAFLVRPRWYTGLLALRRAEEGTRAGTGPTDQRLAKRVAALDRRLPAYAILLVLACSVVPALAFVLLLTAVPLGVRAYRIARGQRGPLEWTRLYNTFACVSLVYLFLFSFLVPNLVPFYVALALFVALSAILLNRFFAAAQTV
jgi:prolipoprotein diacylglyceryltransferase